MSRARVFLSILCFVWGFPGVGAYGQTSEPVLSENSAASAASAGGIGPIVRARVNPRVVTVGEPVTLTITVLVPTWFSRPSVYPSFELPNTILRLPADSTYPGSESIGGTTWSSIVREYRVYPMLAADYRLANRFMTVTYADPGTRAPVEVEIAVPDLTFQAIVPPGAESIDPFLAGRSLSLSRTLAGATQTLHTGDAITLQYTAELDGMPVVFLPPMTEGWTLSNASVYSSEPVLEESEQQATESGSNLLSRRSEKITLVLTSPGEVNIPGLELWWWNTTHQKVEKASIPGVSFSVTGAALEAGNEGDGLVWMRSKGSWIILGIFLALLFFLPGQTLESIRNWRADRRRQIEGSEAHAFKQLHREFAKADPANCHAALLAWLQRLTGDMRVWEFCETYGTPELCLDWADLNSFLYASDVQSFARARLKHMRKALQRARHRFLYSQRHHTESVLPSLNPR